MYIDQWFLELKWSIFRGILLHSEKDQSFQFEIQNDWFQSSKSINKFQYIQIFFHRDVLRTYYTLRRKLVCSYEFDLVSFDLIFLFYRYMYVLDNSRIPYSTKKLASKCRSFMSPIKYFPNTRTSKKPVRLTISVIVVLFCINFCLF